MLDYIQSTGPVFTEEDSEWRFGNHLVREEFIIDKFDRLFEDKPKKYDESIGDFVTVLDSDADISYFVLFLDLGIIAFSRKLQIGPKQFQTAFRKGYNTFRQRGEEIEMKTMEFEYDLDYVFDRADEVEY